MNEPIFTPEQEERIRMIVYEYVRSSLRFYVDGREQPMAESIEQKIRIAQTPLELPAQSLEIEHH